MGFYTVSPIKTIYEQTIQNNYSITSDILRQLSYEVMLSLTVTHIHYGRQCWGDLLAALYSKLAIG